MHSLKLSGRKKGNWPGFIFLSQTRIVSVKHTLRQDTKTLSHLSQQC